MRAEAVAPRLPYSSSCRQPEQLPSVPPARKAHSERSTPCSSLPDRAALSPYWPEPAAQECLAATGFDRRQLAAPQPGRVARQVALIPKVVSNCLMGWCYRPALAYPSSPGLIRTIIEIIQTLQGLQGACPARSRPAGLS